MREIIREQCYSSTNIEGENAAVESFTALQRKSWTNLLS